MLLICPLRPGDNNPELRFAMRSWEANLHLPVGLELLVVGHKPAWLEPDHFVPGNRFDSAPLAVFDNVRLGAEAAERLGHKHVVYMNDDFFCMDPVGAILPVRRDVSLAKHLGSAGSPISWWPKSLALTLNWLAEQGFPDPHSYEVHRPLLASVGGMLSALDTWGPADKGDMVPQWRTVYGVLNEIEAFPVKDAKLSAKQRGIGTPWLSTSDESWRRYGPPLQKRFQKPSRWENDC